MKQQVSYITHSKFYSPAFNAAIFDGPVRIYFAQYQESLALQIYFRIQQRLKEAQKQLKEAHRRLGHSIFVMQYPTSETFDLSFENRQTEAIVWDRLGDDYVIGVRGPLNELEYEPLLQSIDRIVQNWIKVPHREPEATL